MIYLFRLSVQVESTTRLRDTEEWKAWLKHSLFQLALPTSNDAWSWSLNEIEAAFLLSCYILLFASARRQQRQSWLRNFMQSRVYVTMMGWTLCAVHKSTVRNVIRFNRWSKQRIQILHDVVAHQTWSQSSNSKGGVDVRWRKVSSESSAAEILLRWRIWLIKPTLSRHTVCFTWEEASRWKQCSATVVLDVEFSTFIHSIEQQRCEVPTWLTQLRIVCPL